MTKIVLITIAACCIVTITIPVTLITILTKSNKKNKETGAN